MLGSLLHCLRLWRQRHAFMPLQCAAAPESSNAFPGHLHGRMVCALQVYPLGVDEFLQLCRQFKDLNDEFADYALDSDGEVRCCLLIFRV